MPQQGPTCVLRSYFHMNPGTAFHMSCTTRWNVLSISLPSIIIHIKCTSGENTGSWLKMDRLYATNQEQIRARADKHRDVSKFGEVNTSTDTKCLREGQRGEVPQRVRLLKTLKVERKVRLVQATVRKRCTKCTTHRCRQVSTQVHLMLSEIC